MCNNGVSLYERSEGLIKRRRCGIIGEAPAVKTLLWGVIFFCSAVRGEERNLWPAVAVSDGMNGCRGISE